MTSYRAVDGDRIDLIVLKHYGSVEPLKEVLEVNTYLPKNSSMILKAGEIVKLPKVNLSSKSSSTTKSDEDEFLW